MGRVIRAQRRGVSNTAASCVRKGRKECDKESSEERDGAGSAKSREEIGTPCEVAKRNNEGEELPKRYVKRIAGWVGDSPARDRAGKFAGVLKANSGREGEEVNDEAYAESKKRGDGIKTRETSGDEFLYRER